MLAIDLDHIRFGELRCFRLLTEQRPILGGRILRVILVRAQKQVLRVAALSIIAGMADEHSIGDLAAMVLVAQPVYHLADVSELSSVDHDARIFRSAR